VTTFTKAELVPILTYICEEVRRQGHDLAEPNDGGVRVEGMLSAWLYAYRRRERVPTIKDVRALGAKIEARNENGFRRVSVLIGGLAKPAVDLQWRTRVLLQAWHATTPLEFYRWFEEIHPFEDGNGRTGKVLLNWRNGSLRRPVFPPADFWGRRIQNP
jgi:hypothetical protein